MKNKKVIAAAILLAGVGTYIYWKSKHPKTKSYTGNIFGKRQR